MKRLLVLFFCFYILGCGKKEPPPSLVPLSGKIVWSNTNKPVAFAALRFIPVESSSDIINNSQSVSATNDVGTYECATYPNGIAAPERGIFPGKYRVRVLLIKESDHHKIPLNYQDEQKSPLVITVPANGLKNYILKVDNSN